jgi:hypothetical protein
MRKYIFCIILLFSLCLCGCRAVIEGGLSTDTASYKNIETFDFDAVKQEHPAGEPGVITDGFVNTTPNTITDKKDAIELAKKECTADYNAIEVKYDPASEVWLVYFYHDGWVGGDEAVYIDSNGFTLLIVCGE